MANEFMFRLRLALGEKGITRTQLSELSGVSKGDITHYLKGDYVPKQDKCYLLSKALDVDPGWLMTGYKPDVDFEAIENDLNKVPQTHEAKIISGGIDKMSKERREQALKLLQVAFTEFADLIKEDKDDEA